MVRQGMTAVAVLMMVASTAAAQDAKTVLGNASRAMGIENVTAIHFYGTRGGRATWGRTTTPTSRGRWRR